MSYYTKHEVYGEKYYQMPRILFTSIKYKNLSNNAKIAFMLLKDRFNYSVKNDWFDEDGNLYFIYTNLELREILNYSEPTVIKIKKELEQCGLLEQKSMGFDAKKKRNNPHRLYLKKPIVTSEDVYLIDESTRTKESLVRQELDKTLLNQGTKESLVRQKTEESLLNQGTKESLVNQYNNSLDTLSDTLLDTEQTPKINLDLISQQIDQENEASTIPKKAKEILLTFAFGNQDKVYEQFGMIFRAKKEIANKYNVLLLLENFKSEFELQTKIIVNEIYKSQKGQKKIDNHDNFFYISFRNFFEEQAERIKFREENGTGELPIIPDYNYLED